MVRWRFSLGEWSFRRCPCDFEDGTLFVFGDATCSVCNPGVTVVVEPISTRSSGCDASRDEGAQYSFPFWAVVVFIWRSGSEVLLNFVLC